MSYIRCLNNPEGLYIWDESGGKTAISVAADPVLYVKTASFVSILKKLEKHWEDWGDDEVGVRSDTLSIREEYIPRIEKLSIGWYLDAVYHLLFGIKVFGVDWKTTFSKRVGAFRFHYKTCKYRGDYKWVLRKNGKPIMEVWETTLYYLVKTNKHRWSKKK